VAQPRRALGEACPASLERSESDDGLAINQAWKVDMSGNDDEFFKG